MDLEKSPTVPAAFSQRKKKITKLNHMLLKFIPEFLTQINFDFFLGEKSNKNNNDIKNEIPY